MEVINLCDQNSLVGQFMSELRDRTMQQERLRFRTNIQRLGQIMAYEISKRLKYRAVDVETPLGVHDGFLSYFDGADNAFVSAYRKYFPKTDDFVVHIEYIASPRIDDKTLIIVDPMLATGSSMELAYQALVTKGQPQHIHVASVIATDQAIEVVRKRLPSHKTTVWTCDIDHELNEHSYIIPGLGDAGDLLYGEKE